MACTDAVKSEAVKDEIQFRCSINGYHAAKQRLLVTFRCMNMQFPNLNCSIHLLFVSNALQYRAGAGEFLVRDEHHWVYWTTPGSSSPRVIARLMGCPHWAPQFRSQLLSTCNKSVCLAQYPRTVFLNRRAARGSPGICHFSFLRNFHE